MDYKKSLVDGLKASIPGSSFYYLKSKKDAVVLETARAAPALIYLAGSKFGMSGEMQLYAGIAAVGTYIATGCTIPHLSNWADNIAKSID